VEHSISRNLTFRLLLCFAYICELFLVTFACADLTDVPFKNLCIQVFAEDVTADAFEVSIFMRDSAFGR